MEHVRDLLVGEISNVGQEDNLAIDGKERGQGMIDILIEIPTDEFLLGSRLTILLALVVSFVEGAGHLVVGEKQANGLSGGFAVTINSGRLEYTEKPGPQVRAARIGM